MTNSKSILANVPKWYTICTSLQDEQKNIWDEKEWTGKPEKQKVNEEQTEQCRVYTYLRRMKHIRKRDSKMLLLWQIHGENDSKLICISEETYIKARKKNQHKIERKYNGDG